MEDKDIEFVARHYRRGSFAADKAWRRIGIARLSIWRRYRAAAAIAAFVVLTAAAVVIYRASDVTTKPEIETQAPDAPALVAEVKVIDFENTALPEVVERIKEVYGVEIENMPAGAEAYRLSLHYEGTADDLVATINDILGIELTVKQ